jgi:hypothetical protein
MCSISLPQRKPGAQLARWRQWEWAQTSAIIAESYIISIFAKGNEHMHGEMVTSPLYDGEEERCAYVLDKPAPAEAGGATGAAAAVGANPVSGHGASFCNAPCQPGSPYCPEHHALCHLAAGSAAEARQLREIEALAQAVGGKQGRRERLPPKNLLRQLERVERVFSRPNRSRIVLKESMTQRRAANAVSSSTPEAEPPPERRQHGAIERLKRPRMAGEVTRLQQAGFDAHEALVHGFRLRNERLEDGMTHAHAAAAADWLALASRAQAPSERLASELEPLRHIAWDAEGASEFHYPEAVAE